MWWRPKQWNGTKRGGSPPGGDKGRNWLLAFPRIDSKESEYPGPSVLWWCGHRVHRELEDYKNRSEPTAMPGYLPLCSGNNIIESRCLQQRSPWGFQFHSKFWGSAFELCNLLKFCFQSQEGIMSSPTTTPPWELSMILRPTAKRICFSVLKSLIIVVSPRW